MENGELKVKKDWEIKKLGEVAEYINGRAFKPEEWETKGLPIIRIQNLTNSSDVVNYTTKKYDEKYFIKNGDLLFAWSASLGAYIWKGQDAWLNQHIFKVIPNQNVNKDYLFHALSWVTDILYSKTHGAVMVHVTLKPFLNTEIPLPPLEEQKRIVKILDEKFAQLESLKANAQTNLQNAKDLFQSQLTKAFSNTTWEKKRLFEICQNIVDCPHTTPKKSVVPTDYPCIRTSELKNGEIDWSTMQYLEKEEYLKRITRLEPKENDIVYGREGTFGDAVLLPNTHHFSLGQRTMLLRPNSDIINPKFLLKAIISPYVYKQALEKNNGCGVPHVNVADVKNFIIPVPSEEIQKRIVKELDTLSEKVKALQNIYEKMLLDCNELKQSFLCKAFAGEL